MGSPRGKPICTPSTPATAWAVYLGHDETLQDPVELYNRVKEEDLAENDVVWLDRWDLNNTYALGIKQDDVGRYGETISEFARYMRENPGEVIVGLEQEFYERPDGFPAMAEEYGFPVDEDQYRMMDIGLSYEAIDRGAGGRGDGFWYRRALAQV